jgi:hypothetical protein
MRSRQKRKSDRTQTINNDVGALAFGEAILRFNGDFPIRMLRPPPMSRTSRAKHSETNI